MNTLVISDLTYLSHTLIGTIGFALMAVLRIGVKLNVIDLELTVVIPMVLALITGFYIERNIEKLL